MAINRRRANQAYGLTNPLQNLAPEPIVAQRAPTTSDIAVPGTIWTDAAGNDAYVLLEVVANSANWLAIGSGSGTFDNLTVTTTFTVSSLGRGVAQVSAAGVFSSSEGTDGQLLISSSAGAPAWANITSGDGSVVIANGGNTIDLTVSGATASTFPTDAGTATPALGATTITGGTNVNTSGAADVVTINVDNAPTFSGLVTAQAGVTVSAGTTTITSDTDAAQAIYLHADAGTNETIQLHADQGTAVNSVYLLSDVGGITLEATGLASNDAINISAPAGGIDIDGALQVNVASSQNAADAVSISASAGGIDITSLGAAGEDIDITASSSINLTSTEDAAEAIYLRANGGTSETIHIRSDQGTAAASVYVHSDVGGITLDAGLASADAINLTASNGGVDIDGALQVNIASSQSAPTAIVMDASDGAGGIQLQAGTGGILIGNQADCTVLDLGDVAPTASRTITVGGGTVVTASVTDTIDIGVDGATTNADSIKTVNIGTGNVTTGQNLVNINTGTAASGTQTTNIATGTGGGTKTVNVGNADGLTTLNIDAITLINDSLNVNTSINTGTSTGSVLIGNSAAGSVTVDTAADFTVTSVEDAAEAIYLHANGGTSETIRIRADQGTGVSSVAIESDVGGLLLQSGLASDDAINVNALNGGVDIDAALHIDIESSEAAADAILINASDAAGGIDITTGGGEITFDTNSTGNFKFTPGTNSAAGTSITLNSKVAVVTLTGNTTAAGAQETFTITNSEVSATSGILVTVANTGSNDARLTLERVKPAAGSFEVMTQNNGSGALNGDCIISFIVLN